MTIKYAIVVFQFFMLFDGLYTSSVNTNEEKFSSLYLNPSKLGIILVI